MAMPDDIQSKCNGCGSSTFRLFATRGDGVSVKQCEHCGLGVIDRLPADPGVFYGDTYYFNGQTEGYSDYTLVAEHGLGWAAAIVGLLRHDGRVLDIGCADGYLLKKLGDRYQRYGIEVNGKMADAAAKAGISVISNDLFELGLVERYENSFDVVTSIAVFEHLTDFAGGIDAAIRMLKDDGFLLFEVPVLSSKSTNAAWLQSSFEHIYYPTEESIRQIVEARLHCHLIGAELVIKDYASTYVGFVVKSATHAEGLRRVLHLLTSDEDQGAMLTADERRARAYLRLSHMAQVSEKSLESLRALGKDDFNDALIARIAQLWAADLQRLRMRATALDEATRERDAFQHEAQTWQESWRQKSKQHESETRRLRALIEVAQRDSRLNAAQAAQAVIAEMERATALEAKVREATLQAREAEDRAARAKVRAETEAEHRYIAVESQLRAIQASPFWRVTGPARRGAERHPRMTRRLRQIAKLTYWTVRLRLFSKLREVRAIRAATLNAANRPADVAPSSVSLPSVSLLPVAGVMPELLRLAEADEWPCERPLVSVVIPCFNYGHLVADAVRSVEAQTLRNIEIIVVEGGSSSIESRRALLALAEQSSERVRVLLQDKPHRAGGNRNFGISHAGGKYICCLDADDRLAPTYLEKAVFLLESYGYDVVSPGLKFFGDRSDVYVPHETPDLDMLVHGNHVLTCALFRRALWRKVGGYRDSDPDTGHLHEDWLFWVRMAAFGARFLNLREPLFFYRSHGNTLSNSESVLSNELQSQYVRAFNVDVLTPEAYSYARSRARMQYRSPRPLRNLVCEGLPATRQNKTLLLAVPYLILGGAERLLSALVTHLVESGWHVIIVSSVYSDESNGDTTSWFEQATQEIYHLPRFLRPEYWKDFIDYLFASRDISLLWIVGSAFMYDYLPHLKGTHPHLKVVDLLFNTVGHTGNNRRNASYIDLNLVENTEVRQWLLDAGESLERIELIPSGVDLEVNAPGPANKELLAEYGIPEANVIVGFSGRWSEEKDPLGFVEIAKRLPTDAPVTFVMTGTGPLEADLRTMIHNTEMPEGRFVICGPVPDISPFLRLYSILLLPSRVDGRPNIVMEALANGAAVVASRVGALPEMVEDGVQGYLCEPGDYARFAECVLELVSNPDKLASYRQAARLHAEQVFDIHAMFSGYLQCFERLVEGAAGQSGRELEAK